MIIRVANNFFYTKSLPCSLWFFDKGKAGSIRDKVLFIDASGYYTAVDRTLNEWSEWQLRNMSAIVWLYRGETEKYTALLSEYRAALGSDAPFAEQVSVLSAKAEALRAEGKKAVADAGRREKKSVQAQYDASLAALEDTLTAAKEADWLYEKFGEGTYADIPGLCKAADIGEIGARDWSLTPGAYVGAAPAEDKGVDFARRMAEIHRELLELQEESNGLMDTISKNLEEMGL